MAATQPQPGNEIATIIFPAPVPMSEHFSDADRRLAEDLWTALGIPFKPRQPAAPDDQRPETSSP
jgi:hypothetical protein